MKSIVAIVCITLLVGCDTIPKQPVKVEPVEVKVIVPVPYPRVPVLARPALEIETIDAAQKYDEQPGIVVKAYQITVRQLIEYAKQLEAQIDGINKNAAVPNSK